MASNKVESSHDQGHQQWTLTIVTITTIFSLSIPKHNKQESDTSLDTDRWTMSSHLAPPPSVHPHIKLLDLPLELQTLIFDHCFQPWSLHIIDNYWRLSKSKYFCLDSYCQNPDYKASILAGAPRPFLSMTCRHIHRETETSFLKSYTGMLEIDIRSSRLGLPVLPPRFSKIYRLTKVLVMDERAFVDLFYTRDFPFLKELTISCFPIFCPDNLSGDTAPLDDKGFQSWARTYQRLLERRSRKKLVSADYVTVLDSQAEQWDSNESVFCYLSDEQKDIQVVREKLRLPEVEGTPDVEEDLVRELENDHICSRMHPENQTAGSDSVEKSS